MDAKRREELKEAIGQMRQLRETKLIMLIGFFGTWLILLLIAIGLKGSCGG
jgi:hypothetical protein